MRWLGIGGSCARHGNFKVTSPGLVHGGVGPSMAGLLEGEVHLWFSSPDVAGGAGLERLLQPDEMRRCQAIRLEPRRRECLVTRALARRVLSVYSPTAPSAWRFRANRHGKPAIDPPSPLRFNLSNCDGLAAIVVAWGREVGVDMEALGRAGEVLALAERVFSPEERATLANLNSPEARRNLALTLWTLKESCLKARGLGLSLPPSSLSFSLGGQGISLRSPTQVDGPAARWSFASFDVGGHRVAVAAATVLSGPNPGGPPRLLAWKTRPFEDLEAPASPE